MKGKNTVTIIKGSIIAIIITVIGLLILSLVLAYTNISEKVSTPIIIAVMCLSVIIGSIVSSKNIKEKGLINGGIVGFIYIIVIYLLSSIVLGDFSMNLYCIISIILAIIGGILGGIIGVNL